jgi:hypothetical protein
MENEISTMMNIFAIYYDKNNFTEDFYEHFTGLMMEYKHNLNNETCLELLNPDDADEDYMDRIFVLYIDDKPIKACTYVYPLLCHMSLYNWQTLDWSIENLISE